MQHQYVSKNRRGGIWLTADARARIFCSWWWTGRTLVVKRCHVKRSWSAGNVGALVLRHLERDLPEIARGIALQIDEQSAA